MLLDGSYSSEINSLLSLSNKDTVFLSDWNKHDEGIVFSQELSTRWSIESVDNISTYLFSDEFEILKQEIFADNEELSELGLTPKNMAFMSNGTIAAYLCIYELLRKVKFKRALLISPIYYTYINILLDADVTIYYEMAYNLSEETMHYYENGNIGLVIVNIPLYGMGQSLTPEVLQRVVEFTDKTGAYLLIDNIYGGLYWDRKNDIFDYQLLSTFSAAQRYMYIDSLAKKLYLNGAKHCYVISGENDINDIEKKSVSIAGSLSATQYHFIERLYCKDERAYIESQLNNITSTARKNYDLIISMCLNSKFVIPSCNIGFFSICGIPMSQFDSTNDGMEIAKQILQRCNVLTIPHDRYLFIEDGYYFFRVNLLNESEAYKKAYDLLQTSFHL